MANQHSDRITDWTWQVGTVRSAIDTLTAVSHNQPVDDAELHENSLNAYASLDWLTAEHERLEEQLQAANRSSFEANRILYERTNEVERLKEQYEVACAERDDYATRLRNTDRDCADREWGLREQLEASDIAHARGYREGVRNEKARVAQVVEQLETLRQALRETWDDYANAIDEHASEDVRKEARHHMLRRFAAFQDEGWLDSNPAMRQDG